MTKEELATILLENHAKWLRNNSSGSRADLYGADLYGVNLGGANLRTANLRTANLRNADLGSANLYGADLRNADLGSADLRNADLGSAELYGAKHNQQTTWGPRQWLPFGSLILFKKAYYGNDPRILILRCSEEAARTSAIVGRKVRCSFALVLRAEMLDGTPAPDTETEWYTEREGNRFVYPVGEIVVPDSWDPDPLVECTHGIHAFVTREEAVDY